jgi:hypothetical protein
MPEQETLEQAREISAEEISVNASLEVRAKKSLREGKHGRARPNKPSPSGCRPPSWSGAASTEQQGSYPQAGVRDYARGRIDAGKQPSAKRSRAARRCG